MTTPIIQNFEKILAGGKDNTLLRFSLGSEYLKTGDPVSAAIHLKQAVVLDPKYSAAWKLLGRALVESGQPADALVAYREGIAFYWMQLAAQQHFSMAQRSLGELYENGLGIALNLTLASDWYCLAALQGDSTAKEHLQRLAPPSMQQGRPP